ncbi:hypothetical protein KY342_01235, partial [Candidatus Woesearchaeota archaeon]|nr:hypothetical protein [Candidatus Woesearchaeota archaeon]
PRFLSLLIPLAYFGLWFIPINYPNIKPLLISSTIGLIGSLWLILLSFIVMPYIIQDSMGAGIFGAVVLTPAIFIIIGISIIIGIILSIIEWKKIKSKK